MGSLFYFLLEYFPWWAIPGALISAEIANHYRRRERKVLCVAFILLSLALIVLSVLFIVYGGFQTTRPALQKLERTYMN